MEHRDKHKSRQAFLCPELSPLSAAIRRRPPEAYHARLDGLTGLMPTKAGT
jgi:hypothetical protein